MPIIPEAPGRFSTITDCPSRAVISWAIRRAAKSLLPPAAIGTMIRIGRSGQAARASDALPAKAISDAIKVIHRTSGLRIETVSFFKYIKYEREFCMQI